MTLRNYSRERVTYRSPQDALRAHGRPRVERVTTPASAADPITRWNPAQKVWETRLRGRVVLSDPRINKGTAFTEQERADLGLVGLLPPRVLSIEQQATRAYRQYLAQPTNLAKNVFLTALQDRNEVLFFRLLGDHLPDMLPIVYTPTVGEQRSSATATSTDVLVGIYLSVEDPDGVERALLASHRGPEDIDLIIATDAEGILGIGDWGVGGIEIAVGKLNVYTAAAGINPSRTLAVMLDVGTNRQELLDDPLYLGVSPRPGWTASSTTTSSSAMVSTASTVVPARPAALGRLRGPAMRDGSCSATGPLCSRSTTTCRAPERSTSPPCSRPARSAELGVEEHRVVVFGSGTAGIGIADQLRDAMHGAGLPLDEATRRFWCVGRHGLLADDRRDLRDFQRPYARPAGEVADWERDTDLGGIGLAEVVHRVRPSILIGTSGQPGSFTEQLVREMAAHVERPIIMPMSNPTDLAEATPSDLLPWTDGRALVATGSPFAPVAFAGTTYEIAQVNNALIFPGLGLGVIVAQASRITDGMFLAAARAVAATVDPMAPGASLLPQVADLRTTSAVVAHAVARAAQHDGVASIPADERLEERVQEAMWQPEYHPVYAV